MPVPSQHTTLFVILKRFESAIRRVGRYVRFNHLLFAAIMALSAVSFWLSYEFRFDFTVPKQFEYQRMLWMPYISALKLLLFVLLRVHASNWRYVGIEDIPRLIFYCLACSITLALIPLVTGRVMIPRGVILIDFFLSLVLIGGARVGIRSFREKLVAFLSEDQKAVRQDAVVIGAGDAGEMIVREITRNPRAGLRVRALFDDDPTKKGLSIHGISVVGTTNAVPDFLRIHPVQAAIIAIPSAHRSDIRRIYNILKDLNLAVKTLPSLHEIVTGASTLTQLRDLSIADLLGREEILIDSGQVYHLVCGKVVVVTGAGGSIGSELCRQIVKRAPATLVLMERSENNLFQIHRRLVEQAGSGISLVPLLCDVNDAERMSYEFDRFRPDLVFHAAAYKHVPMQEFNPVECFRNNVGSTRTLVQASDTFGVSAFLLISTDKAVHPTSVMGATKRVCELYCQAYAGRSRTRFLSVRFGNVLASDGSVVPIFMEQIARGGPITVTHPDMRRYFMTIPEAVTLVLQAAALGESGQVMVLEMGEPVRIMDMVQQLIQLVGKDRNDIPIEIIGIRPGEKLTEELSSTDETSAQTVHSKIRAFNFKSGHPEEIVERIHEAIRRSFHTYDGGDIVGILRDLVPEYEPDPLSGTPASRPANPHEQSR